MTTFTLFGTNGPARSPRIDAADRLNLYADVGIDVLTQQPFQRWFSRPGLTQWLNLGASPVRGWRVMENSLYVVAGSTLWRIGADGYTESLGSIGNSEGRCELDHNGVDLVIADGSLVGWSLTDGALSPIPTWGGQNSVACLGGFFATDSFETAEILASDYTSTEFVVGGSKPDTDFTRPKYLAVSGDILYVMSRETIEPWQLSGQSYPFTPTAGGVIRYGLAAPATAVAYMGSVAALVQGHGELHLALLNGYTLSVLSDSRVEREWSTYAMVEDAVCCALTADARPLLAITFPSVGKSWLYDGASQVWSRLSSGVSDGRFIGQLSIAFGGQTLVSDYRDGRIYRLDLESRFDGDEQIVCEATSNPVTNGGSPFVVSDFRLRMETGATPYLSGPSADPKLLVSMADNGEWREWRELDLGRQGERWQEARLLRCGQFCDLTVKVRLTDPIRFAMERVTLEIN